MTSEGPRGAMVITVSWGVVTFNIILSFGGCGGGGGGGGMLIKWNSPICDSGQIVLYIIPFLNFFPYNFTIYTHHPGESTYRVHCSQTFHIIKS